MDRFHLVEDVAEEDALGLVRPLLQDQLGPVRLLRRQRRDVDFFNDGHGPAN